MEIQKSIEIFLEKNNLYKTLLTFKSQSKKKTGQYGPNKSTHLSNIHKFTLNTSNEQEIREHFQKTDPNILNKAVKKLKRNTKVGGQTKPQILNLTQMKFFKKLLQKQNFVSANNIDDHNCLSELKQSRAFSSIMEQSRIYENQWDDENDIGYNMYQCTKSELIRYSQQIAAHKNDYQQRVKQVDYPSQYYENHFDKIMKIVENARDKKKTRLPPKTIFKRQDNEEIYPLEDNGITYDSYDLKIIYDREKTGFQQQREIPIVINEVLAARYQILAVLGQAQFSKAIQVKDLQNDKNYCIKIIQNNKEDNSKDYFDQSIDQIKLLRFISANCNTDECHLLTMHDFFYHKEHLMIVTELLKDNLYDAYKMYPKHFDLNAIQAYSRQILKGLQKLHFLHIIHTDLKPENILIKSYSKMELKIIDVGSSIYFHDKLSFYVQTRSYRAPQVILGCPYDDKIDIWSFGCLIFQIFTGQVLFESDTIGGLLAKMQGVRGPWPSWMIEKGKYAKKYFTKEAYPYEQIDQEQNVNGQKPGKKLGLDYQRFGSQLCKLYIPKRTNLRTRLKCEDKLFIDFLSKCLKLDPSARMSAKQALRHPFLAQ